MAMVLSGAVAMPLPDVSKTAFCAMSSWGVTMPDMAVCWDGERVRVRVAPEANLVVMAFKEMPPVESPASRMCMRS